MPLRSLPSADQVGRSDRPAPTEDADHRSRVVYIRVVTTEPARMYVTYRGERAYVTRCRDRGLVADLLAAAAELGARAGLVAEPEGAVWRAPGPA